MCGIAGFNGVFSPDALKRMGERIAHRGPDSSGFFHAPEHRVGLAHRRHSIIDLSPNGSQQMSDASGQVVIVFNGEIYNFSAWDAPYLMLAALPDERKPEKFKHKPVK